jgi:hypothetical protein
MFYLLHFQKLHPLSDLPLPRTRGHCLWNLRAGNEMLSPFQA